MIHVPYNGGLAQEPANDFARQATVRVLAIEEMAQIIAAGLADQGQETDNLGDGESVVLMCKLPTINLIVLAEKIMRAVEGAIVSPPATPLS